MTGWGRTRGEPSWAKAARGSLDGCRIAGGPERGARTRRWPARRLLSVGSRSHAVAQQARPGGLYLGGVTLDLRSPTPKLSLFMVVLAMPKGGGLLVAIRR